MDWEKIFAIDATNNGLISKIYRWLIQLSIKKTNNPIRNKKEGHDWKRKVIHPCEALSRRNSQSKAHLSPESLGSVLVSSGCRNKILRTEWLKPQKFISHSSGGWEVQDQSSGWFCSLVGAFLLVCSQQPSSPGREEWGERGGKKGKRGGESKWALVSPLIMALIPSWGSRLTTSFKPNYRFPLLSESRVFPWNLS